jgi:hypothetical protein
MTMNFIHKSFGLVCLGFTSIGCAVEPQPFTAEPVANDESELYGGGSLATLWLINNMNVPVCFTAAGNATLRQLTRETLEDTWSRVTPVRFTGFDTCTSTNPAALPNTIAVSFAPDTRGFSEYGRSDADWTSMELISNDPGQHFRYEVMHEFGHALAFFHDQVRPDNWNGTTPVYCNQFNPGEEGGFSGGITYSGADNDSIMSYCSGFSTALSARDVIGVRAAYGSSKVFSCQDLSDIYGIDAGVTWGFAPSSVQTTWQANSCGTHPSSPDTCQKASDLYGIDANVTWGFAPGSVQTWWTNNGCNTRPVSTVNACQRASDTYGITAFETWGTAPADVQTWWTNTGCNTSPRNQDACQRLSDQYGIQLGDTGWAPTDVANWWNTFACRTSPVVADRCQLISDNYGTDAGVTFAAAPSAAQTWWVNNGCNTHPQSTNSCQRASDVFAIDAGVSFGFAPAEVQSFWTSNGCNTKPTFQDVCQVAADRFGIVGNVTWGAAPADVRSWWVAAGCDRRPIDAAPVPG